MVRISCSDVELVDNGTDNILFAAGYTLDQWSLTEPLNPFEECRTFRPPSYALFNRRSQVSTSLLRRGLWDVACRRMLDGFYA